MVVIGSFRGAAELRKHPRSPLHRKAWIYINKDTPIVDCQIVDISDGGARLELTSDDQDLPNEFILLLVPNGAVRRHCCFVWRSKATMGVQFISDETMTERHGSKQYV